MKKIFYNDDIKYPVCKTLLIVAFIILLNGCGSWKLSQLWDDDAKNSDIYSPIAGSTNNNFNKHLNPNPLSLPQIPEKIQRLAKVSTNTINDNNIAQKIDSLVYETEIICTPLQEDIIKSIQENSKLYKLKDLAPSDKVELEFRVRNDEIEINKILNSYGYYSGKILTTIDYNASPVLIKLNIELNAQYKIENTFIKYKDYTPSHAPTSLKNNGLANGSPAIAKNILNSVDNFSKWLKNNGYPFATITRTRYAIDNKKHTLFVRIVVNQGELIHMGNIIVNKDSSVNSEYLNRIKTWTYGEAWNERKINRYINKLSQKNIFGRINLQPDKPDTKKDTTQTKLTEQATVYDALLEVQDSAQRSVGGGISYETDKGPGIKAFWENRNMFSSTEKLSISTELRKDKQLADITFEVPDFMVNDQTFTASAWINNNNTDAYDQQAAWTGVNIERIISRSWRFSIGTTLEGGSIQESNREAREYYMIGLPLNLRYSSTRRPLNRSKGIITAAQITPYTGWYRTHFSVVQGKININTYYPILDDDKLILALKTSFGSLFNNYPEAFPASIRFYAGGSDSIRGYKFQSVGPRNLKNNPIGGSSSLVFNLEARFKITDTIGIVPFVDGGNVFHDAIPNLKNDILRWGAGVGLRYYTAIGPLRLDVATPINPRKNDAPFFMYISIGQSF